MSGPTRWGDILLFDAVIGGFAAGAWAVSVLPLALFGTQRGWFFHVVPAPVIGAVCGVALLVLEYWIFFDVSPADLRAGGTSFQDGYLMVVAAVIGAVTWWTYTWRLRRSSRGSATGS